ncbi:hypothetical protein TNCV_1148141 [Trichonephila clavipes]|nr:hypothetical protein TNCV_1148141 [Trichonephila clavipes]
MTLEPKYFKSKNEDACSKNRANMGYTNQFQRQFPKHNQSVRSDKTVSCYICGGPHFARNCTKKTMNSEKRITDTGHAVNQIETSISNQNDFLFNELQYIDVIVDEIPLRATLDSGANSVIINSKYVSEGKRIHSQIVLTSCFGEKRSANVSEFTISLKGGEKKKILAAVCRIEAAILLPSKVSETFDECLYDVSHISNSGIRDKVQTLIENYCPNKTETTALKMKIILSDEKPIAQRSRRLSLPEKREVEKQIDEWLEQGIIRESFISGCGAKLELHTDACKLGLGAVLLQQSEDGRFYPIHYISKKTSIQEEKLCSYELEVLAVIEALKNFEITYWEGNSEFKRIVQHLRKTLDKKELTPKMARWSIFLTDFDYEVVHRPAKQMQHVDALSRHPVMLVTSDELTYKIVNAQESDEYIRTIKKLLQEEDLPLSTYHVNFIGPLPTTNKNYNHIFTVIDAFTKFTWLYPTKSTTAQEAIERLKLQQKTFGNPSRVISDKGGAFRSKEFEDYCADEQISNVQITTGVPRGNGQVERIHGVLIPVLTKMSIEDPTKWFKHVDSLQRVLNSVPSRSSKYSPFELLIGVKMKNPEDVMIRNLIEEESQEQLFQHRDNLRREAKQNILKIQEENRRTYNRKRKEAHLYKKGDLVAIMRTQFGNKLKLRIKYFGPYQVTKVKPHDRYDVAKIGDHEGPNVTSASADQMKIWTWH